MSQGDTGVLMLLQYYIDGAQGGALFNKGDVIVDGAAEFTGNVGGVRSNTSVGSVVKPCAILYEA